MRATTTTVFTAVLFGSYLMVAGCETHQVARVGEGPREQIAYAATAKYPSGAAQQSEKLRLAAVDDMDAKRLTIMNLTDTAIPPSTVWVNGAYVHPLPTIPARGTYSIDYEQILMAGPNPTDLKQQGQAVSKVELQTEKGLFTVQGPSKKMD
jgi:hypothetical protein